LLIEYVVGINGCKLKVRRRLIKEFIHNAVHIIKMSILYWSATMLIRPIGQNKKKNAIESDTIEKIYNSGIHC